MKKLIFFALAVLVALPVWAGSNPYIAGSLDNATSECVCGTEPTENTAAHDRWDFCTRVCADGGTVIASDAVIEAAYQMLRDNSLTSNVLTWCGARFAVKKSGNNITKIYDLGSNDHDGTGTGSSSTYPQYESSTQNSLPGISFGSTANNRFDFGNIDLASSAHSAFMIVNGDANIGSYGTLLHVYDGIYTSGFYSDASSSKQYRVLSIDGGESYVNKVDSSIYATSTTYYLIQWKTDTNWKINGFYYNTTSVGTATTYSITKSGNSTTVGTRVGGFYGWKGHINEWLILNKEPSSGELSAIRTYLNGVWALY